MPRRSTKLVTGEIYHVLNRSVQGLPIFRNKRECNVFLELLEFYLQPNPPMRFSFYRRLKPPLTLKTEESLVTVMAYCLMPNHFHLILRQEKDEGISTYIRRATNSFSHFYNTKYRNKGPLFLGNFRAIRVENDEQLAHLSRYIHLNPVTGYLVEQPEDYVFSSYGYYLGLGKSKSIDPAFILSLFPSKEKYKQFVLSRRDYQRKLAVIKSLVLE